VHRRKAPLKCYSFLYIGADLCKPALQPDISEHCQIMDTGWCFMWYAYLLPQLLLGTHPSLTTEGRLRLSRPGCMVLRRGGLPVQRRSPTQALTGPSVEQLRWSSPTCYRYTESATITTDRPYHCYCRDKISEVFRNLIEQYRLKQLSSVDTVIQAPTTAGKLINQDSVSEQHTGLSWQHLQTYTDTASCDTVHAWWLQMVLPRWNDQDRCNSERKTVPRWSHQHCCNWVMAISRVFKIHRGDDYVSQYVDIMKVTCKSYKLTQSISSKRQTTNVRYHHCYKAMCTTTTTNNNNVQK